MKRKYLILAGVIGLTLGAGFLIRSWRHSHHASMASQTAAKYYCPMHPTYTSDKPGDCPICNMKLIPMEQSASEGKEGSQASLKKICLLHKCKMANCLMELPLKAGEKISCPICGTHVAEAAEVASTGKPLYYRHPMRPEVTSPTPKKDEMGMDYVPVYAEEKTEVPVPGQASTIISEERRQMIGMRSELVARRELVFTVRASGRVAYDPDLYNAIAEYREAVKARDKVKGSPWPDVHERAEALVRASRLRLRQMGLSETQIEQLATADEQSTNLLLGGAGGTVWVYAQIYEYEIGLVKPGQSVELTTPAYPGRKFHGVVKAVDPILSAETRSLKVRIEVPNPQDMLKLEMYVNAVIRVDLGERLAVPEDAVLETGTRQVVFVDLGEGRIEPREITVGREAEGYYEVVSGLKAGEKVVTSAQFLVDSESRLKAALKKTGSPGDKKKGKEEPERNSAPEHRH